MTIIKFEGIICQDTNTVLHVRICRLINWEKAERDRPDGFQFVLVDKENKGMHAVMNCQVPGSRFCQGLQYKITKFWLANNCQSHVIVPGPFIYVFDEETEFQYVPELHPTLPLYWFNFVDIGILRTKLGDSSNMPDVIGRVIGINPTTEISKRGKIINYCRVRIENERNEIVTIRLKKHAKDCFNAGIEIHSIPPTVVAFTSLLVEGTEDEIGLHSTRFTIVFINPCIEETQRLRTGQMQLTIAQPQSPPIEMVDIEISHVTFTTRAMIDVIGSLGLFGGWYNRNNEDLIPMFTIRLNLKDHTGSLPVDLKGKAGDELFGISCEELVDVSQNYSQHRFPDQVRAKIGHWFVWELLYQPGQVLQVLTSAQYQRSRIEGVYEPQPLKTMSEVNQAIASLTARSQRRNRRRRSPNPDEAGPSNRQRTSDADETE